MNILPLKTLEHRASHPNERAKMNVHIEVGENERFSWIKKSNRRKSRKN